MEQNKLTDALNEKLCPIVRDLLPLYADGMVNPETKELVEDHLQACAACRTELDSIANPDTNEKIAAIPLKKIKKALLRKRLTAMLLVFLLTSSLFVAAFSYLTAPQYLSYDETDWMITRSPRALADGSIMADGLADLSAAKSISANLLVPVSGTKVTSTQDPDSGKTVYFITAWRTPLDTWRGTFDAPDTGDHSQREMDALLSALGRTESARTLFTLDATNCAAVYYSPNNGQEDVLLCGSADGGVVSLPRLALGYYALLALVLLAGLGLAWLVFRRKRAAVPLGYGTLVPMCYLLGHLLVKGFTATSYQLQRDLSLIVLAGTLLYCAALLALRLYWQKHDAV